MHQYISSVSSVPFNSFPLRRPLSVFFIIFPLSIPVYFYSAIFLGKVQSNTFSIEDHFNFRLLLYLFVVFSYNLFQQLNMKPCLLMKKRKHESQNKYAKVQTFFSPYCIRPLFLTVKWRLHKYSLQYPSILNDHIKKIITRNTAISCWKRASFPSLRSQMIQRRGW